MDQNTPEDTTATLNKCASCGAELHGDYCSACGEKKLNAHMRSLVHIFQDILQELTSLDGKIWQTMKTLLLFPGRIDYDYHVGKRVVYLKPITLFFIINIVFVTFSPLTDFYVNFQDQLALQYYSQWTTPLILQYVESSGMTIEQFAQQYDQLVVVVARSLIILQVPFFALFTAFILFRKTYFSGDYFTFALNSHSWILLWIIAAELPAIVLSYPVQLFIDDVEMKLFYVVILVIGVSSYLAIASREMFKISWLGVLTRLPFLVLAFHISHGCYRFLQLFITALLVEN